VSALINSELPALLAGLPQDARFGPAVPSSRSCNSEPRVQTRFDVEVMDVIHETVLQGRSGASAMWAQTPASESSTSALVNDTTQDNTDPTTQDPVMVEGFRKKPGGCVVMHQQVT
jgi:hypothetical protein